MFLNLNMIFIFKDSLHKLGVPKWEIEKYIQVLEKQKQDKR